jgi:hypothetical protein
LGYQTLGFFHGDAWFGYQRTDRANGNTGKARIASGLGQSGNSYGTDPGLDALESKIKDTSTLLMAYPDTLAA